MDSRNALTIPTMTTAAMPWYRPFDCETGVCGRTTGAVCTAYTAGTLEAACRAFSCSPVNLVRMVVSRSTFARSVPVTLRVSSGLSACGAKPTVYWSVTPRECSSLAESLDWSVLISTSAVTTSEPPAFDRGLPKVGARSAIAVESRSVTELCDS
ncbi:hypothetical protein O1M54_05935 [Streptomyces diastatochromogenes]|nr:hypothetical protein [Streptomyces diastatochromogenes]